MSLRARPGRRPLQSNIPKDNRPSPPPTEAANRAKTTGKAEMTEDEAAEAIAKTTQLPASMVGDKSALEEARKLVIPDGLEVHAGRFLNPLKCGSFNGNRFDRGSHLNVVLDGPMVWLEKIDGPKRSVVVVPITSVNFLEMTPRQVVSGNGL